MRAPLLFAAVACLFVLTGEMQSWNVALAILNMALVSAIMAMGVNIQWGYAGLFNIGGMGFVALGGLAAVLVSMPPVPEAWAAGGVGVVAGLALGALTVIGAITLVRRMPAGRMRTVLLLAVLIAGFILYRRVFDPAVSAVEAVTPAATGYLGGLGLPILLAWPAGGLIAAGAAWLIGKTALGLRSDYLAIATLGISEIVIAILKNEDWLARGVKNVIGLPRPTGVPFEVELQRSAAFLDWAAAWGFDPMTASSIVVKLAYAGFFVVVLGLIVWLAERALRAPGGRLMRAIRDNEVAAEAMGKDVTARHLQVFVLGSAVIGIAGAMMTTLDGQLTPGTYQPLRFTFLIWVMVIIGGSGNNWGAVLGGFVIWWLWVMVEPIGLWLMEVVTSGMADGLLKDRLIEAAAHMRLFVMGLVL
ncbi:MAG: branched-chain amino acid ABC transporter permease, partial [Gemmobacter sp.]